MKTKSILIVLLFIVAGVMIYFGIKANINPPTVTGIGFVIIALLFLSGNKSNR